MTIDVEGELNDIMRSIFANNMLGSSTTKYGSSRHAKWRCEDHYIIGYSTAPIVKSNGGKYDGKYACIVWKPNSKKNPKEWNMVYWRVFSKRKTAKEYALKHYYKHSPRMAARHGR